MKKIDLGGIQPAAKTARSAHRSVEITDPEMHALLTQFTQVNPQFKSLKHQNDSITEQLKPMIAGLFFAEHAGIQPESSTLIAKVGGHRVMLITKNAYTKTLADDSAIIALLGQQFTNVHFRQATVLKMDLDKVPEASQEAFAQEVLAIAQKYNAGDAVTASQCIQPAAGFHEARTTILTPEQNKALQRILPITAYAML